MESRTGSKARWMAAFSKSAARGKLPQWERVSRCRANMAHIRQSRPDSGLGFQVIVLKPFKLLPLRSEAVVGMHFEPKSKVNV